LPRRVSQYCPGPIATSSDNGIQRGRRFKSSRPEYETEIRAERILAGQAAARAAGKVWGGGKPGRRVTLTEEKERTIKLLHEQGKGISEIARVVGLSRPTVYKVLG
jgi:DNA invertase Pin-like site-specific DNA recombinase